MARFKVTSKFNENQSVWFLSNDQKITNGRAVGFMGSVGPGGFYPPNPQVQIAVERTLSSKRHNESSVSYEEVNESLVFTSERKLVLFLKRK